MSPEQSTGDAEVDGRTDLYSLACVLFEMLTGAPPFTGGSSAAILLRRRTEPPPLVRELRPEVPSFVEAALSRALSPVPGGRHRTGAEFCGALKGGTGRRAGLGVPYARGSRPP
jgi:eukaryotic-like serine/threonine-protein kinase